MKWITIIENQRFRKSLSSNPRHSFNDINSTDLSKKLIEECKAYRLQMHTGLFFRGKQGCSVLDVHNSQPEKCRRFELVYSVIRWRKTRREE